MEKSEVEIGFIGIGKMGKPMANRLIDAGYSTTLWNRTREKAEKVAEKGAEVVDSPREVGEKCDVVFSMVLNDEAVKAVNLGENGAIAGLKSGDILIESSTITPQCSAEVAKKAEEKDIRYLRAPVSGSTTLAEKGELSFLVSGDEDAYNECLPFFQEVLGNTADHVGDGEEAKYLKLIINMLVATTPQILAEGLVIGEKAGVDWDTMIDVINNSVVGSPLIGYKVDPLKEKDFTPAFTINQMEKDVDLALETATEVDVPVPVLATVKQSLREAEGRGKGDLDYFSLLELVEENSGL